MIECILVVDATLIKMEPSLSAVHFKKGDVFSYITKQEGIVALRHVESGVAYLSLKDTFEDTFTWTIHKETPQ